MSQPTAVVIFFNAKAQGGSGLKEDQGAKGKRGEGGMDELGR
jgi:hypothetical protein